MNNEKYFTPEISQRGRLSYFSLRSILLENNSSDCLYISLLFCSDKYYAHTYDPICQKWYFILKMTQIFLCFLE